MYCEVWEGQWDTRGAEESSGDEIGGKKADVKKVSVSLTASISLMRFSVGSLESDSDTQAAREGREGAQGLNLPDCRYIRSFFICSLFSRHSSVNFQAGQHYITRISCRFMVSGSPQRLPRMFSWVRRDSGHRYTPPHGKLTILREKRRGNANSLGVSLVREWKPT
jgi:hypothetical protein